MDNPIKQLAAHTGQSQAALAAKTGYTAQSISNVARGRTRVTYQLVGRVAFYFGHDAGDILRPFINQYIDQDDK